MQDSPRDRQRDERTRSCEATSHPEKLFTNIPEGVIITDRQGRIREMDAAAREVVGEPDRTMGFEDRPRAFGLYTEDGRRFFPAEKLPPQRALQGMKDIPAEQMVLRRPNGSTQRLISMSAEPIVADDGVIEGATIHIQDLCQRGNHNGAPPRQVHSVTGLHKFSSLLAESSNDVNRIANSVAALTSVIYELEELRGKVDSETGRSLKNAGRHIQAVLQDLRPPTICQFGLEKTIRSYIGDLHEQHPEFEVHVSLARDYQLLPEEVRLALFRVFQQALANIVRHSQATEISVRFSFDAEEARLEISDNGKGFKVPPNWIDFVRDGHYGLAGAAERVNALGGVFVVESQEPSSTTVRAVIPWKEPSD